MSDRGWRVPELEQEPLPVSSPGTLLVTMHFLLTALRRRWPVWVGLGCAGMLMGLAWAAVSPPARVGTVTLLLEHDPSADPYQAQSTDVSLLRTRTLAVEVIERLDLTMAPDEFQESVVAVPASTDVLALEVSGPDDATAAARAEALGDAYLEFRAAQMRSQLEGLTRAFQARVTTLRAEVSDLRAQYDAARASGPQDPQQASIILGQQAQLENQIDIAQESIEDATLKTRSVIDASYVLDPASAKPPPSAVKTAVLAAASGLIGGTALGAGFVIVMALTSNRLRLREDVALALEAPVRVSVGGRLRPTWWPSRRHRIPGRALRTLVDTIERELPSPPEPVPPGTVTSSERPGGSTWTCPPTRLALATVQTAEIGALVTARLAVRLSAKGVDVFVVDLSPSGAFEAALRRALRTPKAAQHGHRIVVHRPHRVPALAHGPLDSLAAAPEGASSAPWVDAWKEADVTLALGEVDPALGAEHLKAWADEAIVLVAAGRSSAERLRTAGELMRFAGLQVLFAMMAGTDRTDESPGLTDVDHGWPLTPTRTAASATSLGGHVP